ncbi:MAG: hypothetical protein FWD68_02210 [Alphaproteobacteria bacterium]|nr:hypothetical protein [Alphaproteobacteria bacterium]
MTPDFNPAFPRMPRGAPYEAARAQRRLKRTEQLLRTSRPLWSGLDVPRCGDSEAGTSHVCAGVTAARPARSRTASSFEQALSPAPAAFARPRQPGPQRFVPPLPCNAFDIRSVNDLAVVIDAIRDRHLSPTAAAADTPLPRQTRSTPPPLSATPAAPLPQQRHPAAARNGEPSKPLHAPRLRPRKAKPGPDNQKAWFAGAMMALAFATGIAARDDLVSLFSWTQTQTSALGSSALSAAGLVAQNLDSNAFSLLRPAASRGVTLPVAPDTYGLYALTNGRLARLEPLRNRVPDTTIALPGLITTPSTTSLADGHPAFVAFQRDLISSAPDRATVRVLARLGRVLSYTPDGTLRATAPTEDSWATRAVSMEFTVAPVADNPEMVFLRPAADATLAPGRYMLVFRNTAYDFSIQGRVTGRAHCVERMETQSGPIYSECRDPV